MKVGSLARTGDKIRATTCDMTGKKSRIDSPFDGRSIASLQIITILPVWWYGRLGCESELGEKTWKLQDENEKNETVRQNGNDKNKPVKHTKLAKLVMML